MPLSRTGSDAAAFLLQSSNFVYRGLDDAIIGHLAEGKRKGSGWIAL
jgi:hypothetical protein